MVIWTDTLNFSIKGYSWDQPGKQSGNQNLPFADTELEPRIVNSSSPSHTVQGRLQGPQALDSEPLYSY